MRRLEPLHVFALAAEFLIAFATLVLFTVIYADDLRTTLWEIGGDEGWNSNPRLRIYYYANHREPPEVPLIWSQRYAFPDLTACTRSTYGRCQIEYANLHVDQVNQLDPCHRHTRSYSVAGQGYSSLLRGCHVEDQRRVRSLAFGSVDLRRGRSVIQRLVRSRAPQLSTVVSG